MPVKRKIAIPQLELSVSLRNGITHEVDSSEDVQLCYENRLGNAAGDPAPPIKPSMSGAISTQPWRRTEKTRRIFCVCRESISP
jgi:hypothetical protein